MPLTITPNPSAIFIDKLSMTFSVDADEQQTIKNNSMMLLGAGYAKEGAYSDIYEKTLECIVGGYKTKLIIQFEPRGKFKLTHKYLRIEFNANKATLSEVKQILDMLLVNGYLRIMQIGIITSAELATDISYLHISQLIIDYPYYIKGSVIHSSDSIETIIIGSLKSDNNVKAYDKTLQLMSYKQPSKVGLYNDVTRIEITMANIKMNLAQLPNIPNTFDKLKIAAYPKHHVETDFIMASILTASCVAGYPLAIDKAKKFNPHLAKDIEYKILKHGIKGWWDPSDIWKGVQKSVDTLLLK
jgi:hypothetical protein